MARGLLLTRTLRPGSLGVPQGRDAFLLDKRRCPLIRLICY